MLIADAFRILSEANDAIATLGSRYVDQANTPKQPKTLKELIRVRQLYNIIMKFVFLNDAGTAITGTFGQNDPAINRLLLQLKRAAKISTFPAIPNPIHSFITESCCGSSLPTGASEGDFLYFHNSSWTAFAGGSEGQTIVWSDSLGPVWSSAVGNGIPGGGSSGQFLIKNSNTPYDVVWDTLTLSQVTDVTSSAAELNVLNGVTTASVGAAQINTLIGIDTGQTIQDQFNALISTTLNSGQFLVGNGSNVATAVTPTGDVTFNNSGLFAIASGVIVDADVNASAAITRSKLATGANNRLVINSSIGVMTDAAAITASRVLLSDTNGIPVASTITTTQFGYYDISSSLQASLDERLVVNLTAPAQGDILQYNGTDWVNLILGTSGQVLTSNGTSAVWGSAAANGLPSGGSANEYLRKIDGTPYNTEWHTLVLSDITNVATTFTEINLLAGLTVNSTLLNYLTGATGNIQTQLDAKQSSSLAYNALWVGNASNVASQLAPGTDDYVLTMVGGAPQWQATTPPGNVSGVAPSVDNAITRWNGTLADSIQNSTVILDDTGNMVFPTATAIRSNTSAGNTLLFQAYDVDGTAYVTFATLTSNNTPTFDLNTSTTIGTAYVYRVGGTDVSLADGGTGASLSDPGADRVMFWDDSLGAVTWLTMGSNLSISGTTLNATGGGSTLQQKDEPGTTYSPADADDGYIIYLTSASGCLVTMPNTVTTDISVTFVRASGAGTITFQDDGTSVLYTIGGEVTIDYANGWVTWVKRSATDWNGAGALGAGGGGSGGVNSVNPTSNRITISGTAADPIVDIAATYVGQSSITTLGTIGTGVWQGTVVGTTYGGTGLGSIGTAGQLIRVNAGATAIEYFTPSYITGNQTITLSGDISGSGSTAITTAIGANKVLDTMIRQSAGLSVIGRSTNSTGDVADITAASDYQVFRRSGTSIAFGAIDLSQSAAVTGILDETNGGTGQSSVTTGDLLYGSASNVWSKLAGVATGNVLLSGGLSTAPAWGKADLTSHVSGILPVANGGTGVSTGAYLLATGGTATGANTFTSNTISGFTWDGAFTTTANDQVARLWSGTYTMRGTTLDFFYANRFASTLIAGANSQIKVGTQINHTFNDGAFTGQNNIQLLVGPVASGMAFGTSTIYAAGTTLTMGASNSARFVISGLSGSVEVGSSASETTSSFIISQNAQGNSGGKGLIYLKSVIGASGATLGTFYGINSDGAISSPWTTNFNYYGVSFRNTFAPSSSSSIFTVYDAAPTIDSSGGTTTVTAFDYHPTESSMTGVSHYGMRIRSTTALSAFGMTAAPTARLHIGAGTTTVAPLKLVSGTALSSPDDGALEYDTSHLWFTIGSTRYQLDQQSGSGISGLTSGRVPYANSSTTITDEGGFEYNSSTNILSVNGIELGNTSDAGSVRTVEVKSSSTNASLLLIAKAAGSISAYSENGINFTNFATAGSLGIDLSNASNITLATSFRNLILTGGNGPSAGNINGYDSTLLGGDAFNSSGNGNGGSILIQSGLRRVAGSGVDGNITLDALSGYLILANIPTSSAGLPTGAVWSNSGILTIV